MAYYLPDMTLGNAEKDSPSFGLEMARFIDSEWGSSLVQQRRSNIKLIRSHMEGEVDVSHLKPLFNSTKDLSVLRVNWKYSSEVPKFINSIVEGFSYDKYRAIVKSVDAHSQEAKSKFRREKLKAMYAREDLKKASEALGVDLVPKGFIPESKDELNLFMELEYKPAHELAPEIGIQKVMDFGDWRDTLNHVAEDIACHRLGAVKVEADYETAVRLRYVDINNFVYSRNVEGNRDYTDAYYFGEYVRYTLGQLEKMIQKEHLSPDKLKQLVGLSGGAFANFANMTEEDKQHTVDVLHFTFKTNRYRIKKKKYNSHGTYKYIDKDDYWSPPKGMKSEVVRIPYEVWYEGIYIPGADVVFGYRLVDNMLRDPNNRNKAIPPYIMYRLSSESIAQKIVDISDRIYLAMIKMQQFVLKMKPKGFAIDIDALQSLDLGDSVKLDPIQQVKIMMEDGNLLYSGSSLVDDQTGTVRLPMHDMPDGTGRELAELINVYNALVQRLHDITGINPQATGAAPPSRTSSAVYQGTVGSAMRVTNNIYNGVLSIQKRAAEAILARLYSASMFGETEQIVRSILGEYTTDIIKSLADMKYHQYIVNIDVRATDIERAELMETMNAALQTGTITLMDKIDIEEIDNLRLAKQVIKLRQKANMEKAEQNAAIEHRRKLEEIQMKGQSDLQRMQMENDMKIKLMMAEKELETKLEIFKAGAKQRDISLEKQWDYTIANVKAKAQMQIDTEKEDRKDLRQSEGNEQQSELIDQRQNQSGPKKFEKKPIKSDDSILPSGFEGLAPNV